ncbi:small-conductance mechanosensitive channel [Sphingobium sp. OAS761]|uniref:mechanosensitive ion channel family protein n=1 Tax=Sphingobium sp. OAS761 TaxID=2817901 RepID=UPI0020A1EC3C|nr:mechanosensitive ion channel domain-containing protein [Sphingobium sp. OAS761]MCP1468919.1 small-conductance mechanosensitive channel [Sphingobium sp. OAS761]
MADTKDPALPTVTVHAPNLAEMWRSTTEWFAVHYLQILIALGAGALLYLLLATLKEVGKRHKGRRGSSIGYTNVLGRTVAKTTHFFMIMVAARLVVGYADAPPLLLRTVVFLFTIATALQAAVWAREVILGLIERRTLAEDGQGETLANAMGLIRVLVTVALFAIATIVVLDNLGVNVTGLVAGLGIGGIAIGLAAQGIFSDLFAALSIIFDKPFRRGEAISYDNTTATVERIGLKSTRLRALTGEKKVISNANLLQKEITSYLTLDHRRLKFAIGVIYQTPPDVADQIPGILKAIVDDLGGKFIRSGFVGFGDSSLNFELEFEVYLPDWDAIYVIRHKIGLAILRQFNDRGIEFAYPTQTTFTSAPDGRMIMPYAEVQPVRPVDQ